LGAQLPPNPSALGIWIERRLWNEDKAEDIEAYEFYGYCLQGTGSQRGIEVLQEIFNEGNSVERTFNIFPY